MDYPMLDIAGAEAIQGIVSEMTSMRALQVVYCGCTGPGFREGKVIQTIACFKNLEYLYIFSDDDYVKCSAMECLLEYLSKLHTLRIEMPGYLDLPERPELYAQLENLAVMTGSHLSKEIVAAITLNGNNLQLKQLGLIAISLPEDGILDILNGCPNLHTCIVYCQTASMPHDACNKLVSKAKKLAKEKKLVEFKYEIKSKMHIFGSSFAYSDLNSIDGYFIDGFYDSDSD